MNTHKLINVTEPTNLQNAATKNNVDNSSQKSNYLGMDANSSFSRMGQKSQILPTGLSDASTIFSFSEGPGILRRLWIANNGTVTNGKSVPGNIFIRIHVDDVICIGSYVVSTEGVGIDHVPLALD